MEIKSYILNLEKKKIISRKINPLIPFILFLFFAILLIPAIILAAGFLFILFLVLLAVFALIFAVLHFIVWIVLKNKFK